MLHLIVLDEKVFVA